MASTATTRSRMLLRARDGILWLGSLSGEVYRYDPVADTLVAFPLGQAAGGAPKQASGNAILTFLEDSSGRIWMGTWHGGVVRYDPETGALATYRHDPEDPKSLPNDYVPGFLLGRDGAVWVGTGAGLARYDEAADGFPTRLLPNDEVRSLLEDPAGMLWAGTGDGLARLDLEGGERRPLVTWYRHDPKDRNSIQPGPIYTLFLDRSGVVWAGTRHGLSAFEWAAPPFALLTHRLGDANSLDAPHVRAVFARDSTLWVGTHGGLNRVDRATGEVTHFVHDPADPSGLASGWVVDIRGEEDGTVWVTTRLRAPDLGQLQRFDPATGRVVERYQMDPGDWPRPNGVPGSLPTINPGGIFDDSQGRRWVTASSSGCPSIMDRDAGTFTPFCLGDASDGSDGGSSNTPVWHIAESPDGALWFVTQGNGIVRVDPESGTQTHYRHDPTNSNSLAGESIETIYAGADETLWIGYFGAGFSRFDPETETFTHYNTANSGLTHDVVYSIEQDAAGDLWLGTHDGLVRFSPATETFTRFGLDDGLQDLEFESAVVFRSSSGEMLFGGVNGVNTFFPDRVGQDAAPPQR